MVNTFNLMVDGFGRSNSAFTRKYVGFAYMETAAYEFERGKFQDAAATCRRAIEHFDESETSPGRATVALAWNVLGDVRRALGEQESALGAYETVLERFAECSNPVLQRQVVRAHLSKGMLQQKNGDVEGARGCFDLVVERYARPTTDVETAFVATALLCRAMAEEESDRADVALHTASDAVHRFAEVAAAEFRPIHTLAICYQGRLHILHGDVEAAIGTYEDALVRFQETEMSDLALTISHHLSGRAIAAVEATNHDEVLAMSARVVQRFGASQSGEVQAQVATAILCRVASAIESGSPAEGLAQCDDIEARLERVPEQAKPTLTWQTNSLRAKALLALGNPDAALKSLGAAYKAFVPSNDFMMGDIQRLVTMLSSTGVSAGDLVDLLLTDPTRADSLSPLVTALRRQAGERVRVPDEVSEVANDVTELINEGMTAPAE